MAKTPFAFHSVSADWGANFPDGDYTIGRGADPRSVDVLDTDRNTAIDQSSIMTKTVDEDGLDDVEHEPFAKVVK